MFAVFPGLDAEAYVMPTPKGVGIYDPTDEPGSHPALFSRLFIQVIFKSTHMTLWQSCARSQRYAPCIGCERRTRTLRANNEDLRLPPASASFPSNGSLFSYSNCGIPGQKKGQLIWRRELLDYVCPLILAKTWPSAQNCASDYVFDDRGTRAVIRKLIKEKWIISAALSPFAEIVVQEFEKDVGAAQTGEHVIASLFHDPALFVVGPQLRAADEHESKCERKLDAGGERLYRRGIRVIFEPIQHLTGFAFLCSMASIPLGIMASFLGFYYLEKRNWVASSLLFLSAMAGMIFSFIWLAISLLASRGG
jgi:hypothetical protein